MRELNLTGESFALVGEVETGLRCECGSPALYAGRCESCANQHNQNVIESEARQRLFFDEADCGGVFACDGNVYSDADPGL